MVVDVALIFLVAADVRAQWRPMFSNDGFQIVLIKIVRKVHSGCCSEMGEQSMPFNVKLGVEHKCFLRKHTCIMQCRKSTRR